MKKKVPNPGSKEAVKKGCCCPIMDNRRGTGMYIDGNGMQIFVISEECKLHGRKKLCRKK